MRERPNLVRQALLRGETASGIVAQINCPEIIEIAGAAGFDFVYIDCEHGSFYLEGATAMIRAAEAAGITPLVRVPNHDSSFIGRILDAGAMGVVVPNVSCKGDAEAAVAAARYKDGNNGGRRGACPGTRASWHQATDWPAFMRWSNQNVMVWPLIETPEACENFDDIAGVAGIDAVMLGPFDLAHALGHPGNVRHPNVVSRLADVVAKSRSRSLDVVASLFSAEPGALADDNAETLAATQFIAC